MKRLLSLISIFALILCTSFTASPEVDTSPTKDDWVYELVKPDIKKFEKEAILEADYLAVRGPLSLSCSQGLLQFDIETNSVPYGRYWDLEFYLMPGSALYPYATITVYVPENTTTAFGYGYVNWACGNTLDGNTMSHLH